jgi:hypothetical protein
MPEVASRGQGGVEKGVGESGEFRLKENKT